MHLHIYMLSAIYIVTIFPVCSLTFIHIYVSFFFNEEVFYFISSIFSLLKYPAEYFSVVSFNVFTVNVLIFNIFSTYLFHVGVCSSSRIQISFVLLCRNGCSVVLKIYQHSGNHNNTTRFL